MRQGDSKRGRVATELCSGFTDRESGRTPEAHIEVDMPPTVTKPEKAGGKEALQRKVQPGRSRNRPLKVSSTAELSRNHLFFGI